MAEALKALDYQQAMRLANAMGALSRAARFRAGDAKVREHRQAATGRPLAG